MSFEPGDKVRVTAGDFEGSVGEIGSFDAVFAVYLVDVGEYVIGANEGELELLRSRPAPSDPGFGMSLDQLTDYLGEYVADASAAGLRVGYEDESWETTPVDDLLSRLQHEVIDVAAVCALVHLRIERVRRALKDQESL